MSFDNIDRFEKLAPAAERMTTVISRHWNNPQIHVHVNQDKIELITSTEDFVRAIVDELGEQPLLMTRKMLQSRVMSATIAVLEKIKIASAQVM